MYDNPLDVLVDNPTFEHVPREQLEWLAQTSEIHILEPGEYLYRGGESADHLFIILDGEIEFSLLQNGKVRSFGSVERHEITGVLPYSRLKEARGIACASKPSRYIALHRDFLKEMIHDHHELTSALVHTMTNRVRNFTSSRLQDEKLMALGKLSAGLAHELNNPAAAIVRSSQALKEHLQVIPESFKAVTKVRLSDAQVDSVNELLFRLIGDYAPSTLSLMEKTDLEDEMADWLEDNGTEDGFELAELLIEFGFRVDDLEMVMEQVTEEYFPPVIKWIHDNLTTEKMVQEIAEASKRISDLVSSVKGYTHMDRSTDKQLFDVHQGLRATMTMLKHKVKQNKIEVREEFQEGLEQLKGHPSEVNQVFTNMIDNALDAMEENGGTLTLRTHSDGKFLRVFIQDTGPGISEENLLRIFDPFFTTKDMGKGTGMGLDIAHKIVQKHQGDIKVESEPGNTVFELCFPINPQ